jgi:transcriptional regulator with XRE-family HTH domain
MATIILISPIQLYNLLAVRRIRLHYGISAQDLSLGIGKSINYIGTMENEQVEGSYDDTVLTEIAKCISEKIKNYPDNELEFPEKKEYTIYDFYPSEILSDEKVIKKVDPIPPGVGPSATLNALIESDNFFKKARTLNEIVKKCNSIQNQNWVSNDFTKQLDRATKGKSKKLDITLKDGLNNYILAKKQKKD